MPGEPTRYQFEAIGTHWDIEIHQTLSAVAATKLLQSVHDRIASFDRDYSRFRTDSLVTAMSLSAGTYQLPQDARPMMELYETLYDLTDGAMTPLIGQVLVEAGYDADYSLKPGILHRPPTWSQVMAYTYPELVLRQPALLDFGAAGKGYLVDIVSDLLRSECFDSFSVDAGGDMVYQDSAGTPLRVGLEHPEDHDQVIGTIDLMGGSICASAGNRRTWSDYHHIMHPQELQPVRQVLAVWTTAPTALVADGLATALFFAPGQMLQQHFDFEYLLLRPDYSVEQSAGFGAELFTT